MSVGRLARRFAALVATLLLCACFGNVASAAERTSSGVHAPRSWVDRRIDGLSDHDLLTRPAEDLVDANRAAIARGVVAVRRPLFFAWSGVQIFALLLLWSRGGAARLRDLLARRLRARVPLRAAYACVVVAITSLATLPFNAYAYRLALDLGVSRQPLAGWLHDYALGAGLEMLSTAVIVVIGLELVDRTRRWYVPAALLIVAFGLAMLVVQPLVIAPLFHRFTPIQPDTPLGARLVQIEERAGLHGVPIFETDLSRTTEVGNAYVAGIGPSKRIVIGDTLLRTATPREVAFVMAHELGHDRHGDALRITLLADLLVIVAIGVAVILAERIPIRPDDDNLSRLTLIGALTYAVALLLYPVGNGYSRGVEAGADRFGITVTHDPAAAARVFIRFADEGFSPVCPPRAVEWYFYDHPTIEERVAAAAGRTPSCAP